MLVDPDTGRFLPQNEEDRFWRYVERGGAADCWIWSGSCDKDGYGRFAFRGGRGIRAHRYMMRLILGRDLEADEKTLHHCDNPPCVNPDHLYLGDAKRNAEDREKRGRRPYTDMAEARRSAIEARRNRTHCINGHEFDEMNTYRSPKKPHVRICRACMRIRARKHYAKKSA